ncbi:23551_t:CDS:2, partial [Cetraspora pellucida]
LSKRPKGKQTYYFMALMNNWPIKVLLDEGASGNMIGQDIAIEWNLLQYLDKDNRTKAVLLEGKTISNLGEVKATIQIEDIQAQIKVTIIKGEQPYLLLSEVDQAKLHITKDRQNKIALINNKPISYQEMGSDTGYRYTPLKVRKNILMVPNVFGKTVTHTCTQMANQPNKTKQNNQQSKNAEEKKILLKKQVERNQQRIKLVGVTCNGNWVDIVRTALATDSNLLQIFLEYKEPKAADKNRSDIIDNINEILKELVQQQLEIGILLENSASNNCYGATIPDLMDIVNMGRGKRIDEYRNIYNMYGYKIIVTHVNNSSPEVIFGKEMDKHAHIMDTAAKIPIEVYQMIAGHKEVYAMILETPNNEITQQIAQIHKKQYKKNVPKKRDQELEQNIENYEEINEKPINKAQQKLNEQLIVNVQEEIKMFKETNGIVLKNKKGKQKAIQETIPDTPRIGRFVKENLTQLERVLQEEKKNNSKEIEKGLKQLRYRLQTIEDNYKYISNLPDKELESHLGTKNKDVIEQIEEEYQFNKYTLLNMTKEEFNQMPQWEQQIAMRNFLIGSEFLSEKVKKQFQDKYKELLASSLENQEKMHDDDEVEKRFVKDQKLIRGTPQPEPFPPENATHNRYISKENTYRKRPVSPTSSEEDFNLKSRNIGEWLKSQAKEPPRPSSPIKDFVNKNIVDPIFRSTHERNSNTSSLPKISSSLKNEINLEDDEKEFKLQKPPVRYKRTRTVVSTDMNLSSTNGDKWKRERDIRRKFFQETQYPVARNSDLTDEQ